MNKVQEAFSTFIIILLPWNIFTYECTCTFTYIDLIEVSFALFVLFEAFFLFFRIFTDCQLTNTFFPLTAIRYIFEHYIYGLNMINAFISIFLFHFTWFSLFSDVLFPGFIFMFFSLCVVVFVAFVKGRMMRN